MLSVIAEPLGAIARWLLGLNLVQSRRRNVADYLGIMLVATALGANPVAAWLAVLSVRCVGRLTIFRAGRSDRVANGG